MNAVISLCHFCELHGPSVLFCTQAFRDFEDQTRNVLKCTGVETPERRSYYGPADLICPPRNTTSGGTTQTPNLCEGCTSLTGAHRRILSNDHEARVSYISSQFPLHSDLFSTVRQACVRSLSCEVCPGREGPIFFGDKERGHVLSYTFFMRDSQARGFQRWYSIIVVMNDKIFLLNSWPFLVGTLRKFIEELQGKASKLYEKEQSECSQRVLRLNSMSSMTPDNFRRQRGNNAKVRSLVDLTGDPQVFLTLHLQFTWLLKVGQCRLSERLFEGFPCEDTVVDLERQEETEEGFIKVHTKKVDEKVGVSSAVEKTKRDEAEEEGDKDFVSPCKESSMETSSPPLSLRQLFQIVGKDMFMVLAYHTVIGNQIIFRGSHTEITLSIIQALKCLLPRGCCHPIPWSTEYIDSWKCNFLGLPPEGAVPKHVLSSPLHLCINVVAGESSTQPFQLNLHHCTTLPEKLPQILVDVQRAIQTEEFTETSLEAYLTSIKEVWMKKVKVLFTFSRGGQHSTEDTQKLLRVLGAHEQDRVVTQRDRILSISRYLHFGNENDWDPDDKVAEVLDDRSEHAVQDVCAFFISPR